VVFYSVWTGQKFVLARIASTRQSLGGRNCRDGSGVNKRGLDRINGREGAVAWILARW